MAPLPLPKKPTPNVPPQGNLSDAEYQQMLELQRRSQSGGDDQQQPPPEMQLAQQPRSRWPWTTICLMIGSAVIYGGLLLSTGNNPSLDQLNNVGALNADRVFKGEWLRFLTATFIHSDLISFIFNIWFLYSAGKMIELILGRNPLLFLYLYGGAAAGFFAVSSGIPVSALGDPAVFAVIGAKFGVYIRYRRELPPPLRSAMLSFLPLVLIYGIIYFVQPLFDLRAVGVGIVAGMLVPIGFPRMGMFKGEGSTKTALWLTLLLLFPLALGYLMLGWAALNVNAVRPGEIFRHPDDGWEIVLVEGYTAEVYDRNVLIRHPMRDEEFAIQYDRKFLRQDADESLKTLRDLFGLYRGNKEKVKEVLTINGVPHAFIKVESPDSTRTTEILTNEEVLRLRPIYFLGDAPTEKAEFMHEALFMMVTSFKQ